MNKPFALAVHGGAGTILKADLDKEKETAFRLGLKEALKAGFDVLHHGGSSLDAVAAAVVSLEDCPLFNAGRGSVFTRDGVHEMDAAIMDGRDRTAGAVAGVTVVRNPVLAARLVMEQTPHIMLIGRGAEEFAAAHGLEPVDPSYFYTQARYEQLLAAQRCGQTALDHDIGGLAEGLGTVGAVACDQYGDLAAATSTGGMTNKLTGRVGDSPVIGAGVYADNRCVAVSATGTGEAFIRCSAGHDIAARILYLDQSLEEACETMLDVELVPLGGRGGVIAVDRYGNVAMPFRAEGMYRGVIREDGKPKVWIFH